MAVGRDASMSWHTLGHAAEGNALTLKSSPSLSPGHVWSHGLFLVSRGVQAGAALQTCLSRPARPQEWQGAALDALAAWLGEDPGRLEPRLAQRDAVQRFVALFAAAAAGGDSEALARLLDSFLRLLRRSPKLTVRARGAAPRGLAGTSTVDLRRARAWVHPGACARLGLVLRSQFGASCVARSALCWVTPGFLIGCGCLVGGEAAGSEGTVRNEAGR